MPPERLSLTSPTLYGPVGTLFSLDLREGPFNCGCICSTSRSASFCLFLLFSRFTYVFACNSPPNASFDSVNAFCDSVKISPIRRYYLVLN